MGLNLAKWFRARVRSSVQLIATVAATWSLLFFALSCKRIYCKTVHIITHSKSKPIIGTHTHSACLRLFVFFILTLYRSRFFSSLILTHRFIVVSFYSFMHSTPPSPILRIVVSTKSSIVCHQIDALMSLVAASVYCDCSFGLRRVSMSSSWSLPQPFYRGRTVWCRLVDWAAAAAAHVRRRVTAQHLQVLQQLEGLDSSLNTPTTDDEKMPSIQKYSEFALSPQK